MAHQGGKPSLSLSTKIALGIIAIVGIAGFLYYEPDVLGGKGLDLSIGGDLGSVFGQTGGDRLNFTMVSSKGAIDEEVVLKDSSISVTGRHLVDSSVGDSVIENGGDESGISFKGFDGVMNIEGKAYKIDGTAESASVGEARLKPKSKTFPVSAQIEAVSYSIGPVSMDRIVMSGVDGSIEKSGDEQTSAKLANSTIEVSGFQGSVSYDGRSYTLSGSAAEIKGKSFTLKG